MTKNTLWGLTLAVFIWPSICPATEVPHEVAGFELGSKMTAHLQSDVIEVLCCSRTAGSYQTS